MSGYIDTHAVKQMGPMYHMSGSNQQPAQRGKQKAIQEESLPD